MTSQAKANLAATKTFIQAVEQMDGSFLDQFFAKDVQQIEWPNLFKPAGEHRSLEMLKADIEKARGVLEGQQYEITREIASDQCVMLEMVWRGQMVVDFPPLKAGQSLCAHCVAVFDFENGKVTGLRNYDCFEPF